MKMVHQPPSFSQLSTSQEYNIFPNLIWLRFPRLLDVALREGSGGEGAAEQLNTCWPGRLPRGRGSPLFGPRASFFLVFSSCQMSVSMNCCLILYTIYGFQPERCWFWFLESLTTCCLVMFGNKWCQGQKIQCRISRFNLCTLDIWSTCSFFVLFQSQWDYQRTG